MEFHTGWLRLSKEKYFIRRQVRWICRIRAHSGIPCKLEMSIGVEGRPAV